MQWYLFVYLFVKEDIIFSQAVASPKFERCDEMVISSAIFAKSINNLSDLDQIDPDSQCLIKNLYLDEDHMQ